MKINELKINGFGKLKDKEIKFEDGINIVYGENESGKSSLLKFISSMFYGTSKNKNGKETEAENVKFYTAEEMKERTVSKYGEQIVYSEDRTICGYNAFYSERIYDSPMGFANATGEISVYVSNDKTEEDDFFAISLTGTYRNETEKQEIIDAINSLEIY